MSEIEPKKSISIKKSKKKKVTIEESVSSFDDGRGGKVTISTIQSYGPDDSLTFGSNDGPLIQEFNEDGTINEEVFFQFFVLQPNKSYYKLHRV
jgi:hypothetical protein